MYNLIRKKGYRNPAGLQNFNCKTFHGFGAFRDMKFFFKFFSMTLRLLKILKINKKRQSRRYSKFHFTRQLIFSVHLDLKGPESTVKPWSLNFLKEFISSFLTLCIFTKFEILVQLYVSVNSEPMRFFFHVSADKTIGIHLCFSIGRFGQISRTLI